MGRGARNTVLDNRTRVSIWLLMGWGARKAVLDNRTRISTGKLVLRGRLWDKEKVAL
jgi:hypothetical protein